MRRFLFCCTMIALLGLFFCVALSRESFGAPKRVSTAKPGNCGACHGKEKVFSPDHPDTKAMVLKDCLQCHDKTGGQRLAGKLPGSHVHALSGITCAKCHGKTKKPAEVAMKQCVACHGDTGKLAERTAKVKPENPHTSPHYGTELDCNVCHRQHSKSENFCGQCHSYKFLVP